MKRHRTLRRLTPAFALILCLGAGADADDALFTSRATLHSMSGQQIYEHICSGCHMGEAQGASGAGFYPKLAGNRNFVSWEFVALTVLNGRNGMPPFGLPAEQAGATRATHLSDAQVADVVNYVRSHFQNSYSPDITSAQVATLPHPSGELQGPQ